MVSHRYISLIHPWLFMKKTHCFCCFSAITALTKNLLPFLKLLRHCVGTQTENIDLIRYTRLKCRIMEVLSTRPIQIKLVLRTTVPLVSYIWNSLRFWYYASLSTCCQNLKKNWGHWEIWEKVGVKLLRDLTKKSVNFSTLATSSIRLLLGFGEEDQ